MSTTTTNRPPKGWDMELQGLSNSVIFTKGRQRLIWSDGRWHMAVTSERGEHVMPARGVPAASSMKEARAAGSTFLAMVEDES